MPMASLARLAPRDESLFVRGQTIVVTRPRGRDVEFARARRGVLRLPANTTRRAHPSE